jgi:uncharacterized protein with HEPN domain
MFDKDLVQAILLQIDEAIEKIKKRTAHVESPDYFTGTLLSKYPEIDWPGVMGFRDIIAHHYFDIDAEQVFWICKHNLEPLSVTIKKMIQEME